MDREGVPHPIPTQCRPHARGDGPKPEAGATPATTQAPRTRGWTGQIPATENAAAAGPTHVGTDRGRPAAWPANPATPHAREDGPAVTGLDTGDLRQAPRTWGWTAGHWEHGARTVAGPTHVGMDR